MTPRESTIQNRISEPTRGVTSMGSSEKKITGPFSSVGIELTTTAMMKPRMITRGVTMKV